MKTLWQAEHARECPLTHNIQQQQIQQKEIDNKSPKMRPLYPFFKT